jgi:hypothetical protein
MAEFSVAGLDRAYMIVDVDRPDHAKELIPGNR